MKRCIYEKLKRNRKDNFLKENWNHGRSWNFRTARNLSVLGCSSHFTGAGPRSKEVVTCAGHRARESGLELDAHAAFCPVCDVPAVLGEMRRSTQRSSLCEHCWASGCEHEETAKGVFLNSVICGTWANADQILGLECRFFLMVNFYC